MTSLHIDPKASLKIVSLETDVVVQAQFNPKELQVDTSLTWTPHQQKGRAPDLEFGKREPQSMQVELLFDGFDGKVDVMACIDKVQSLTQPMTGANRRPPKVKVIWESMPDLDGRTVRSMPSFYAIIEKTSVKYQMWSYYGGVLRASVTASFKEAGVVTVARST